MDTERRDRLLDLSNALAYPVLTCEHLRKPHFGDFRSPLLTAILETASSCLLCLVVSTVVGKMLPHVALAEDATVRIDVLETLARATLCVAAHAGPVGRKYREEKVEVYSHCKSLSVMTLNFRDTPDKTSTNTMPPNSCQIPNTTANG
jgi:hypothetical protein